MFRDSAFCVWALKLLNDLLLQLAAAARSKYWRRIATTDMHQRSQTSYFALCNGVVSYGAQFGVSMFLLTTHAKTNANQMCSQSSHTIRFFMCVFLHAQTAVYACNICTWRITVIFYYSKDPKTPNLSTCQDNDGADFGISGVYLW